MPRPRYPSPYDYDSSDDYYDAVEAYDNYEEPEDEPDDDEPYVSDWDYALMEDREYNRN